MTNPAVPNFPAQDVSWSDVARACRRVCLLREQGHADDAEHMLRGSVAAMINRLRTPEDGDDSVEARLDAILTAETERVSNAAALAELLAPLLRESLHGTAAAAPIASASRPTLPVDSLRPAEKAHHLPRPPVADIADFIDEMLAQERPPEPPASRSRRAS